ncbi:hypothetical protein, partial [Roseiflexus castenholzii]|uniref:hypothetical protein n=1 Tax=Roseiflexus castenholzii TaxID=120962 RepID=UPI003C7D3EA8
ISVFYHSVFFGCGRTQSGYDPRVSVFYTAQVCRTAGGGRKRVTAGARRVQSVCIRDDPRISVFYHSVFFGCGRTQSGCDPRVSVFYHRSDAAHSSGAK